MTDDPKRAPQCERCGHAMHLHQSKSGQCRGLKSLGPNAESFYFGDAQGRVVLCDCDDFRTSPATDG